MHRLLALALITFALSPLFGCGTAQAIAEYAAADAEWDDYQNEKAAKARASYEAGMALHAKYMANQPKASYGVADAQAWYDAQSQNMKNISNNFAQVQYSDFHEKIFFSERALAQGWDKLCVELDTFYAAGIDGRPDKDDLKANLDQALLNATSYYKRLGTDYPKDYPEVAKKHADKIAAANVRIAALDAIKAKNDAR